MIIHATMVPVLVSVLLLGIFMLPLSAGNSTLSSFLASCGNSVPPSWLCDPENILRDADEDGNVIDQLAHVNNNTEGEIYWNFVYYYGYVIGAAVVDTVQQDTGDTTDNVTDFGTAIQQAWFGSMICDNSTLVLASLNTSRILIFPGLATDLRLRTKHKEACASLRVDTKNVTDGLITCINAVDEALEDALRPYSNAPWGYAGVVVILTMLLFHYWIKY